MTHGTEQRQVEDAVGARVASREVDAELAGELPHCPELCTRPDETTLDRPGESTIAPPVARCDQIVDTQCFGEWSEQVRRSRGSEHQTPSCLAMLGQHAQGVRLDEIEETRNRPLAGPPEARHRLALHEPGRPTSSRHEREGLSQVLVETVSRPFTWQPTDAVQESFFAQRRRHDRTTRAPKESPVQIHD
jgi:hypothetical protein